MTYPDRTKGERVAPQGVASATDLGVGTRNAPPATPSRSSTASATEPISTSPAGNRSRVRFPDGTLAEVIDNHPLPEEA